MFTSAQKAASNPASSAARAMSCISLARHPAPGITPRPKRFAMFSPFYVPVRLILLRRECDAISRPDQAFDDDRAVDARLVVVQAVHCSKHVQVRGRSIRVQRDHLAAGITLSDSDHRFVANAKLTANKVVFRKPSRSTEVEIQIRAE